MRCPFCSVDHDKVIDSRSCQDGLAVRRRRECLSCKRRFTTYEKLEYVNLRVVKKDRTREEFDPAKIRFGLEKACWKRQISAEQIDRVVNAVVKQVYELQDSEIDSQSLGKMVMEHLARLDQVAYVRFASVYREFKDVREFMEELRPMLELGGAANKPR
jgi:transcriptional repressor NrdR